MIQPYGGALVNLLIDKESAEGVRAWAAGLPSFQVSDRAACDLELLATGGLSPLDRFMGPDDYQRVLDEMRLADGTAFPIPVTLSMPKDAVVHLDQPIALRDSRNHLLATMNVTDVFEWDWREEAGKVLGTCDGSHPFVAEMANDRSVKVSGPLRVFESARYREFNELRLTPSQTRSRLEPLGVSNVIACQSAHPVGAVLEQVVEEAAHRLDGAVLLHPEVGIGTPGDARRSEKVRAYKALAAAFQDSSRILLSVLQLAPRQAGPREALWHAIIRRNFGANYLVVGPEYTQAAVDLVEHYHDETGVATIPFDAATAAASHGRSTFRIACRQQGFCIWFTGLSGSGKSTTADIVAAWLQDHERPVTLLDGDVVRTHLSKELGFSRDDRDTNIRRIGFVAAEIVKHGGAVICAAVSPYRATRDEVRRLVGSDHFIEVFVDTPLAECERRDVKGMYARARMGMLQGFTGVDDPYEPPLSPELTLKTMGTTPDENAGHVIDLLREMEWIAES